VNSGCSDYDKVECGNVIKFGNTKNGTRRFRCKTCGKTFVETEGTPLYRRRVTVHYLLKAAYYVKYRKKSYNATADIMGCRRETVVAWVKAVSNYPKELERYIRENDAIFRKLEHGDKLLYDLLYLEKLPRTIYSEFVILRNIDPALALKWVEELRKKAKDHWSEEVVVEIPELPELTPENLASAFPEVYEVADILTTLGLFTAKQEKAAKM
jgi:transposase-like protein